MKKSILLFILIAFNACQKAETCKKCEIAESWHDVNGAYHEQHTDVGQKCGDDLDAFVKTPWINTYAYSKVNKCK